jgi:hypothetical protein
VDRVESASTGLASLLGRTLDRLAAIRDLASVEAQLESVTASLQAETSTARAQAAAAQQTRLLAKARAQEADEQRAEGRATRRSPTTSSSTMAASCRCAQASNSRRRSDNATPVGYWGDGVT